MAMSIRQATMKDAIAITNMAYKLWPESDIAELQGEFLDLLTQYEVAIYIALDDDEPIAFAQCNLRHDYVEGSTSSPVGYLEGVFVEEDYRSQGLATQLCRECERWARKQGCTEFASDCELDNAGSAKWHTKMGFEEANRIICFIKPLNR